jgi:hypothetical protein
MDAAPVALEAGVRAEPVDAAPGEGLPAEPVDAAPGAHGIRAQLQEQVTLLKAQKKELRRQQQMIARDLKQTQRKRKRLQSAAAKLSTDDLMELLRARRA